MNNKKANIAAIVSFVVVVIVLLIAAPFIIKIVIAPVDKFSDAMTTIDGSNQSVEAISYIRGKFTGMFDWVILLLFLFNVGLLLITSFLIDVHPAFLVVYIIAVAFLVMMAPTFINLADRFYNSNILDDSSGVNPTDYLPMTSWIFQNFGIVILGIIILSGVIMFGKYRFGSSGAAPIGGGANY